MPGCAAPQGLVDGLETLPQALQFPVGETGSQFLKLPFVNRLAGTVTARQASAPVEGQHLFGQQDHAGPPPVLGWMQAAQSGLKRFAVSRKSRSEGLRDCGEFGLKECKPVFGHLPLGGPRLEPFPEPHRQVALLPRQDAAEGAIAQVDGAALLFGAVLAAPVQHQVVVDDSVARPQFHGDALRNRTGGAPLPLQVGRLDLAAQPAVAARDPRRGCGPRKGRCSTARRPDRWPVDPRCAHSAVHPGRAARRGASCGDRSPSVVPAAVGRPA